MVLMGRAENTATTPVPKVKSGWLARHESINTKAKQGGIDLVYIGDSIVQQFETKGKEVWDYYYAPRRTLNLGISGDRTPAHLETKSGPKRSNPKSPNSSVISHYRH